jgi:hypothetical protein
LDYFSFRAKAATLPNAVPTNRIRNRYFCSTLATFVDLFFLGIN